MKRGLLFVVLIVILLFISCVLEPKHEHTFSTEWSSDANYHWHAATCEHTNQTKDKAPHTWNAGVVTNENSQTTENLMTYTCTVCGITKTTTFPPNTTNSNIEYVFDITSDGVITIKSGYKDCLPENLIIPSEISGIVVKAIGNYAFDGCSGLTSITIPDSVTRIGSCAFRSSGIISVTIGNSVANIDDAAFYKCSSLNDVYVSDFSSWCNISFVDSDSNPMLYAKNLYVGGELLSGSIEIPSDVTKIKAYTFYNCKNITSITIPDSVTSIGEEAFSRCSSLTSITIPDSVTSIGGYAFERCSGLTSITIPDSVTSIGDVAFKLCSALTSITIPDSVTSIGEIAFSDCSGLTSITIGNSVTSIGERAFYDCSKLTDVYVSDLSSWCNISFTNSSSNPVLYAKNLYVGGELLSGSIEIPSDVTKIKAYTFYNCKNITSITIPDSVTSIGNYAFYYCSGLTNITIPESVTSIGDYAFYGCSGLTSITFTGTTTQWNTISKGTSWKNYVPSSCIVHCTDGYFSI